MIHNALHTICEDLNASLKARFGVPDRLVTLSELMDLNGAVAVTTENQMICTLLNLEQDRTNYNMPSADSRTTSPPPFNLNLYVLFSAFYAPLNYLEALKALSYTLGFFQGKPIFTSANTPGFDPRIQKISVEMVNVELKDLSNFWTALGAKHLPCVLFRIRMLSITSETILSEVTPIRQLENIPSD